MVCKITVDIRRRLLRRYGSSTLGSTRGDERTAQPNPVSAVSEVVAAAEVAAQAAGSKPARVASRLA